MKMVLLQSNMQSLALQCLPPFTLFSIKVNSFLHYKKLGVIWEKILLKLAKLHNNQYQTAVGYAIIGVAMSSALYFIFDQGHFIETLQKSWDDMAKNITKAGKIAQ